MLRTVIALTLSLLAAANNLAAAQDNAVKVKYVSLDEDTVQLQDSVSVYSVRMVAMQAAATFKDVHLLINSPGGDMRAAEWLVGQFDMLRARGKTINCYAGSYVASAAFFIYLHCDKRYALKSSRLFPHKIHVSFNQPVLPQDLIETGLQTATEQEKWDQLGMEITGMTESDYKAFRDSDNSMWPITKVQQKSTKVWFKVVDYYVLRMVR